MSRFQFIIAFLAAVVVVICVSLVVQMRAPRADLRDFTSRIAALEARVATFTETIRTIPNATNQRANLIIGARRELRATRDELTELQSDPARLPDERTRVDGLLAKLDTQQGALYTLVTRAGAPGGDVLHPNALVAVSLLDYLRSKYHRNDVGFLGFTQDKAAEFHLYKKAVPEGERMFVTKRLDETTFGFTLVEPLGPDYQFRPLTAARTQAMIAGLQEARQQGVAVDAITIYTCSGLTACDRYVAQLSDIIRRSGFEVRVDDISEHRVANLPKTSIAYFRLGGAGVQKQREKIIEAFSFALEATLKLALNSAGAAGGLVTSSIGGSSSSIDIHLAGFPRFDAEGRALFDQE